MSTGRVRLQVLGVSLLLMPILVVADPVGSSPPDGETKTVERQATLSTADHPLWGPTTPPDQDIELFSESWDESDATGNVRRECLSISEIDFRECGNFGAEIDAAVSGEISMSVELDGFEGGTLSVIYPVTVTFTAPADNSFDPGDTVDIETELTVDAKNATIDVDFPELDSIAWKGGLGFAASASARMCFINCDRRDLFDISAQDEVEILRLDEPTSNNPFSTPGCFDPVVNIALGLDTYANERCNDVGYFFNPDVSLETTVDPASGALTATGEDTYALFPVSGVTWMSRFSPLPWYALLNLNPVSYRGATVGWTSFNAVITALETMKQDLEFSPTVEVDLDWGRDLAYEVIDGTSGESRSSATGSSAALTAGDTLRLTTSAVNSQVLAITPTISVGSATLASDTRSVTSGNLELRALSFTIETDRWRLCVDEFGCTTIWPSTSSNAGPVYNQHFDLSNSSAHTIFEDTFAVDGFAPQELEPFDIVPRPLVEVRKAVVPAIAPGSFDLLIDDVTLAEGVGDGASTGPVVLEPGTRVVAEAEGADADLRYFDITITCTHRDGGAVHTRSEGAEPGLGANMELVLAGGEDLICEIQNRLPVPAECDSMTFDNVILGTPDSDVRDRLIGTNKRDIIVGYGGDDIIVGGPGDDCIAGNGGDDIISAGPGKNVVDGGPGDNICSGHGTRTNCRR